MSIKAVPYYEVWCDTCGAQCDFGDWTAFAHEDTAVEMARDSDWFISQDEKVVACDNCPRPTTSAQTEEP